MLPSLGVAVSGALWGLFWIPLRSLAEAGIIGGWGSVVFLVLAVGVLAPIAGLRWRRLARGGFPLLLTGMLAGAGFGLYATSLLFTDVVRAILLFYITPVWSTILGRVLLDEPITRSRVIALLLGTSGLLVILGFEGGFPLPRNAGDWLALLSGITWAYGSIRIYSTPDTETFESVFTFFLGGLLVALVVVLLPLEGNDAVPALNTLGAVLPVTLIITAMIVPSVFIIIWGAGILSPARVGLLLMTEVVTGIISAALLTDEPYGLREVGGTVLIVSACLIEVLQRREA